uniref:Uncharacterized protein n=1 Tax=Arundo donax TaxID=35708 RepID=A0A0A8ZJP8_ARUDO
MYLHLLCFMVTLCFQLKLGHG